MNSVYYTKLSRLGKQIILYLVSLSLGGLDLSATKTPRHEEGI